MEPTLPVWSIRPNWKGGILERLEWLTDVLTSSSGAEQRRSLRLSPRRSLEVTINPTQNERSFVDLLLHRQGSSDWLFPIWFDKARLSASVSAADERIEFDNTYREHGVGGLAILYKDAWTWEVVSIGGQDATGLDLDVPLDADWPKGTAVYPLRRARLQNETELRALSSRVGESVLLWTMVEANEYFAVMPGNHFEGMPVLVEAPNRSSDITTNHTRLAEDRDNQTGIPYRVDPTGRAFQVQSHSFMRHGRQAQSEFRSMLYWLRGRQRAVWIPSYNEDFVTSRAAANGALNLDIQKIGMSYAGQGAIIPGRDVIRVNGVSARVTALGAPQSPEEERLRIGAGLEAAVPAGRPGSFMAPARLNQDAVEIQHHTDTDGTMECSVTWKTFSDTREAGGTIYIPIPVGVMNSTPCGYPGFSGLSWQLPCLSGGSVCSCADPAPQTYGVGGQEGVSYELSIRVRGVAETSVYSGGVAVGTSGRVIKNATGHSPGAHNTYVLRVSDPPASYWLNHGNGAENVIVLDYTLVIPINGGATVTLEADSEGGTQIANTGNLSVADDDPSNAIIVSQPYNGQFMQIDGTVVS